MENMLSNQDFWMVLLLLGGFSLIPMAVWLAVKRNERIDEAYVKELELLFKPDRYLMCYKCLSHTFDEWEQLFWLKILRFKNGMAWCERYTANGKRVCLGEEVNIKEFVAFIDKCILVEGNPDGSDGALTVIKEFHSAWE